MTDKEVKTQIARIQKLIDRWIRPLGLDWWRIHVHYERNPSPDKDGSYVGLMRMETHWEYLVASITVFLPHMVDMKDQDLEIAFLHELSHILVAEMRPAKCDDDYVRHEERVVSTLAYAFYWSREATLKEGKHAQKKEERGLSGETTDQARKGQSGR